MLYAVIVRIGWFKIKIFEKLRNTLPKSNNKNVCARDERRTKLSMSLRAKFFVGCASRIRIQN